MTNYQHINLKRLTGASGVVSAGRLRRAGIHSQTITRLVRTGRLERVARGQYRLPDTAVTQNHGIVLAARATPGGVICLLSALSFHEIGKQLPREVWMAIPRGARSPSLRNPPLRVVRLSGKAFTEGIETHRVEGERLRVYGVAKTLADLFKHRRIVGLDIALEALREAWWARRFTMDELEHAARVCRVQRVMRPYIESLIS